MKNTIYFDMDAIIKEYSAYVYKIIDTIALNSLPFEDKEEILSDTFYLLWKNQEKINTNLKSYLATIARNCAYGRLRKQNIELSYDEKMLYKEDENMDRILFIKQKLEKLTSGEIKLFELFYGYGYQMKEIAKLLGVHISTVKIRLYRLRKKLKEEL